MNGSQGKSETISTNYGRNTHADPGNRTAQDRIAQGSLASVGRGTGMSRSGPGPREFAIDQWPLIAIWTAAILIFGTNAVVVATRIATVGVTTGRALILGVLLVALVLLIAVLGLGYRHYARTDAAAN